MLPRFIRIHSPLTLTKFELVDNEVKDELLQSWGDITLIYGRRRHGVSHTSYSARKFEKINISYVYVHPCLLRELVLL